MPEFIVDGPYDIPTDTKAKYRTIKEKAFLIEWLDEINLSQDCGCYIFGIRNRGIKPVYIGMATKTYRQECFTNDKLYKYTQALLYCKGTPIMFFIYIDGKAGSKTIKEVEDFLIGAGIKRNPDLCNVKGTKKPCWSIKGVIHSNGKGNTTNAARDFKKMMGL